MSNCHNLRHCAAATTANGSFGTVAAAKSRTTCTGRTTRLPCPPRAPQGALTRTASDVGFDWNAARTGRRRGPLHEAC